MLNQKEIERIQARINEYDHQWSQIAEFLGGDARDVPDPYEKSMFGRVKYEIEQRDAENEEMRKDWAIAGRVLKSLGECLKRWNKES